MLSVFPDLLNFSMLSPFVLRIALAIFVGTLGVARFRKNNAASGGAGAASGANDESGRGGPEISSGNVAVPNKVAVRGIFEVAAALLLLIGLFTQVAALFALLFIALEWRERKNFTGSWNVERSVFLLATAIAVSLLFSGAGFFALDLPL